MKSFAQHFYHGETVISDYLFMPECLLEQLLDRRQRGIVETVDLRLYNVVFQLFLICLSQERRNQQSLAVGLAGDLLVGRGNDKIHLCEVVVIFYIYRQKGAQINVILELAQNPMF